MCFVLHLELNVNVLLFLTRLPNSTRNVVSLIRCVLLLLYMLEN